MVTLVNSHINATRIGLLMWEIDLRFASGIPPGWVVVKRSAPQEACGTLPYPSTLKLIPRPYTQPWARHPTLDHTRVGAYQGWCIELNSRPYTQPWTIHITLDHTLWTMHSTLDHTINPGPYTQPWT